MVNQQKTMILILQCILSVLIYDALPARTPGTLVVAVVLGLVFKILMENYLDL